MPNPIDPASDVLGHLYDVAMDPTSYERMLEYWEDMLQPTFAGSGTTGSVDGAIPGIADHLKRADKVLAQTLAAPPDETAQSAVGGVRHAAAFALDHLGRLMFVNGAASLAFGITAGARASQLPLGEGEVERLLESASRMLRGNGAATEVVCVRARGTARLIVCHLRLYRPRTETAFILCTTSEISWPSGFAAQMQQSFGLSATEIELLRHLTEGYSVSDIAQMRSRSSETVRVQVKSLLAKTGARSQIELVRLALASVEALQGPDSAETVGDEDIAEPAPMRSAILRDGRRMQYLVLGDPEGRPVLFLPIDLGFVRWPAAAEAEARRRKLKVIVGVRAGYGASDPVPAGKDYLSQITADYLNLFDHLGITRAPVITMGDDSLFAISLHSAAPERITGIICCSGMLPLTSPDQFARMGKWHRFVLSAAQYTPQFLPFIVKAGAAMARRIGKRRFLANIYSGSEADTATFRLPDISATLIEGSNVTLSDAFSAHDALASELIAKATADWSAPLTVLREAATRGRTTVKFFNGTQDPQVHPDTLVDFQRDYPWIDFHIYPDAGQLVFYLKWRDVLDTVADLA